MAMKLQQIDNHYEVLLTLKNLVARNDKVWLWQKNIPGKGRPIHYGFLRIVDDTKNILEFRPLRTNSFKFQAKEEIFIYAESETITFKQTMRESTSQLLRCSIPKELFVLPRQMFEKLQVIEKENEADNLHKRKIPRKVAQNGQVAGLVRTNGTTIKSFKNLLVESYMLHDISTGGMAFLIDDPGEFNEKEGVALVSIDGKLIAKPLVGEVRSIRKMDNDLDQFKVGVKFEGV